MMNEQVYEQLREVAKARRTTTYSEIAPLAALDMSRADHRASMAAMLEEISVAEHEEGRPLLSVVVVHASGDSAGGPGQGFFTMAKRLGVQKPREDNTTFFAMELGRVHSAWQG